MPRYEFKEGSSNKFWEITFEGKSFTTRWGRIDTDGQEKTQSFDSPEAAQKEYDKLVREKEKKGYELVGDGEGGDDGDDESPSVEGKSNPELEAAIQKDPANVDAYLVYGDWLQSQGDPRGELVALQHAVSKAEGTEASTLKRQITAHIKKHKALLLGGLAKAWSEEELKVEWHLGFIRDARLGKKDYDSELEVPETLVKLLAHPSAKFLQSLTIGMVDMEGENYYAGVVEAIVKTKGMPTLRSLFLGDFEYPDETEISWSYINDVTGLYKVLPNLRSLRLRGADADLGKIDLPELREFSMETGGLPLGAVKSIASANWPKLEKLEVWFGSENYGAEGGVEDIQPILDGKGLSNVKVLGLRNSEFTDELAKALPTAKILPQLEKLDLSMGCLSDTGAQTLADNAAAFKHLKHLDVTENTLTKAGEKLVAKLAATVAAGSQRDYDEEYRYAAVGE
ncbi:MULTISPECIES: WGR domain-containing protein [unclassified Myxococcus]|uniref:WGR domain-containing protein n=1 Tax=unclassified Myxococcus TaxID=2648731 RepID=UPI00157A66D4|nr:MULTISPECIES: WGR domain-containing protein [unclassified Myxococcus]NTX35513.1 WGR domain-containing protein [Myxococcus sp. CA033]NTX54034.1 WGR domain-containing protein [Myxococcus sp. CA039A]